MLTLIVGIVCLLVGAVGGAAIYKKNATKANAIVTAVQSPPKV